MKTQEAPSSNQASVGGQLSAARTRLGWTVEEAAARTRLHLNVIRNLEANRFEKLPSQAYVRGFLRIYSRELGLDPKSILDLRPEMLESLPTRAAEPIITSRRLGFGALSIAGAFVLAVVGIQMYRVWPVQSLKDPNRLAPIGNTDSKKSDPGATAAVAPNSNEEFVKTATPAKSTEPAKTETSAAPSSSLPAVQTSDTPAPKTATPNQLRIRAKKDTWVRVVAIRDGKEVQVFEDTIDEDDMMPDKNDPAWTGESFVVTTREAADAEIIFNDSNFGAYEKPGNQTFRLPAR
ncbi:MAG: helix-turn-helix domain-containing protein [Verrucomicrobia bacterium]|nr:helix-turn-helix domain-containing protein [Verrucomicrobiota bacterium]